LISLHFNGFDKKTRGTETYYRDPANGSQSNAKEDEALATAVNNAAYQAILGVDSKANNRKVKKDSETGEKRIGVLRDPGIGLSGKMCRSCLLEVEFIDVKAVDAILVSGSSATINRGTVMGAVAKALANVL
jgi:N-acetylmuramoyl-L-alanine amidase